MPESFEALVERLDADGELLLVARLRQGARLVRYQPPEIVFSGSRPMAADTLTDLAAVLKTMTKSAWRITLDDVPGQPTLNEAQQVRDEAIKAATWDSPMVRAAREAFPETELVEWPGKRSMM